MKITKIKIIFQIIWILFLLQSVHPTHAVNTLVYFKKIFDTYQIDAYPLDTDLPVDAVVSKAFDEKTILTKVSYISTKRELLHTKYDVVKTFILVCDTAFDLNPNVSCNVNHITDNLSGDIINISKNVDIVISTIGNTRVILIPENHLVDTDTRNKVSQYLHSLIGVTSNVPISTAKIVLSSYMSPWRGLFVALLIVTIPIVLYTFIPNKNTNRAYYFRQLYRILDFLRKYVILLFVVSLILFAVGLAAIIYISTKTLTIRSVGTELLNLLDARGYLQYYHTGNFTGLFVTTCLLSLLVIGVVSFYFSTAALLKKLKSNCPGYIVRTTNIKTVCIILVGSVVALFPYIYRTRLFVLITTLFLALVFNYGSKMDTQGNPLWKKHRKVLFFCSLFIFVVNFFMISRSEFLPKEEELQYRPFISTTNNHVLLPVKLNLDSKYDRFSTYNTKPTSRIFLNDTLLYDKKYRVIHNAPISLADWTKDYLIVGMRNGDYIKALLKSKDLSEIVVSETPTELFRLPSGTSHISDTMELGLSFKCEKDLGDFDVVLTSHEYTGSALRSDSLSAIHFPGCGMGQEIAYTFKGNLDQRYLYELDWKKYSSLQKITLYINGISYQPIYFMSPKSFSILASNITTKTPTELYVYSPREKETFTIQQSESLFDISTAVNNLLNTNYHSEKMILWSDNPKEILNKL